jgi:8-oxo-dGTP pyrophosphatase MutT (NUDIX family)
MAHANYQVATKALFIKDRTILTLTTPNGYVDFPGGRIDDSEYDVPFKECLKRELAEELGNSIEYLIKNLIFVSKRSYEYLGHHHITALFYEVAYREGIITLSDEHEKVEWLTPQDLLARHSNFQSTTEYEELKAYIERTKLL